MNIIIRSMALAALSLGVLPMATGGGWSVIALDEVPAVAVVFEPLEIGFTIRAHGRTLANDVDAIAVVVHSANGRELAVDAKNDGNGHYSANLTFPETGTWHLYLDGYGRHQMPDIEVLAEPTAKGFQISRSDPGKSLFAAKGCLACHVHRGVADPEHSYPVGPELTNYSNSSEFLTRWLADPEEVRPGTNMPNLDLTSPEIELLVAFLNDQTRTAEYNAGK